MSKTEKQVIGRVGENVAIDYLKYHGFAILERNFLRKCGEIDVIARKGSKIHFVEVKTVSREIHDGKEPDVPHETGSEGRFRPEDNLHPWKLKRLYRTIDLYLNQPGVSNETDWQLDAVCVYLDLKTKKARVEYIENIQ